jgi:hypothetical protein
MMDTTKGLFATNATLHASVLDEHHPSVQHAHRVFRHLVSSWASDLMHLRAQGLDVPSHRVTPSVRAGAAIADLTTRRAA